MLLTLTVSYLIILDDRQSCSCNSMREKEPSTHLRITSRVISRPSDRDFTQNPTNRLFAPPKAIIHTNKTPRIGGAELHNA